MHSENAMSTASKTKKDATKIKGKPVVVGDKTYHLIEGTERKGVLLIEHFNFEFASDARTISESDQTIVEKKAVKAQGGIICEGKIGHVDKPTANGRIYSRPIMEREIKKILEKNRQYGYQLGEVDHPGDGKSRIKHVGHVIHDMRVEANGDIWGRYHVLPTTHGKDVIIVVEAGGAIGSSSRGIGTTTTTEEGFDLVGEDFRLATFDLVSDPAASGAYPKFYAEDAQSGEAVKVKPEEVTVEHLVHEFPAVVRQIQEAAYAEAKDTIELVTETPIEEASRESFLAEERERLLDEAKAQALSEAKAMLRNEMAVKLLSLLKENNDSIKDAAKADLASDPMEASAKERLRRIEIALGFGQKIEESSITRDQVISEMRVRLSESVEDKKSLEEQNKKLQQLMVRVAKKSYVDTTLALREDGDEIRESLGDLDAYESVDTLKTKLSELIEEAEEHVRDLKEAKDTGATEERSKAAKRVRELERQLREHRDAASNNKSAMVTEIANLTEHLEDRMASMASRQEELFSELKKERAENARLRRESKMKVESVETKRKAALEEQEKLKRRNMIHQLEKYTLRRGQGHHALDEGVDLVRSGKIKTKDAVDRFFSSREQATSLDEQMTRSLRKGKSYDHSAGKTREVSRGGESFSNGNDSGEFFNEHAEMLNLNPDDVCGSSRFIE